LNLPGSHAAQLPSDPVNPAWHEHTLLPDSDIEFAGHAWQTSSDMAPTSVEYVPAPQSAHAPLPGEILYFPALHAMQGPSSGPLLPARHGTGVWIDVCNLSIVDGVAGDSSWVGDLLLHLVQSHVFMSCRAAPPTAVLAANADPTFASGKTLAREMVGELPIPSRTLRRAPRSCGGPTAQSVAQHASSESVSARDDGGEPGEEGGAGGETGAGLGAGGGEGGLTG